MELNIDVQGSWLHGGAVAMIIEPQLECSSFRHSWIMQENPLDHIIFARRWKLLNGTAHELVKSKNDKTNLPCSSDKIGPSWRYTSVAVEIWGF